MIQEKYCSPIGDKFPEALFQIKTIKNPTKIRQKNKILLPEHKFKSIKT